MDPRDVISLLGTIGVAVVLWRVLVLRDMFRGGPKPPSHPIPGDDSRLLNRRRSEV